jgi:hypothetical protein
MKFCPHTLLLLLRQCGLEFRHEEPARLVVSPADKISPEMRDAIRRHKSDLLAVLPERQP